MKVNGAAVMSNNVESRPFIPIEKELKKRHHISELFVFNTKAVVFSLLCC